MRIRPQFPGAIYHLNTRGNNRRPIYLADGDRVRFLALLARTVARFEWECHAYCLMGNHYHLLVRTSAANVADGMQYLNSIYARWFNRKHGRMGHLFERRYHSELVEDESHFLETARYIVANPVRARLCRDAGEWPWSSYGACAGDLPRPTFLAPLGGLGLPNGDAYRRFVAAAPRTPPLAAA